MSKTLFQKLYCSEEGLDVKNKKTGENSLNSLAELGYRNEEGNYVLPSEYDVPDDDVYDDY